MKIQMSIALTLTVCIWNEKCLYFINLCTFMYSSLVYSKTEYASYIPWVSAVSGWKEIVKDVAVNTNKKIKLKVNGEVKEFDKGIGGATDAKVVYDLEGKGISYLTTYVGTDKNYDHGSTTIRFKVLADGKEVYSSGVIRKNSDAEFVKLNVEGVKELKKKQLEVVKSQLIKFGEYL